MPNYSFSNSKNETQDFFFDVANAPSIGSKVKIAGRLWTRLPSLVRAAVDSRIDPFNKQKFLEKTNKPGKLGDIFALSKELGDKRMEKIGTTDAGFDKFVESSKKRRRGKFIDSRGDVK